MSRDKERRQTDTGGRVAFAGLADQSSLRDVRELLPHASKQSSGRDHYDAVGRHEAIKSVNGVFKQGLWACQRKELLR